MCISYAHGGEEMTNARININKNANRIINIIKAKYDLRDKSQAIEKLTEIYDDNFDANWEIKPSYVRKMNKIMEEMEKNPGKVYKSTKELDDVFKGV